MPTKIKLSSKLKKQVARAAKQCGLSPHAFMLKAIGAEIERSSLREDFVSDATAAERHARETGTVYEAREALDYFAARARGLKAKRPKPRA